MLLCGCLMANAEDISSSQATLDPAISNSLTQQRQLYSEALELARRGKWQQLKQQRQQLQTYPLYPYLIYADLASNLRYTRHPEVSQYLQDYAGTIKAAHLRNRWLDYLAKRQYWTTFTRFYNLFI